MSTGNDSAQPNATDPTLQQQPDPNAGTPPAGGADPNRLTFTEPQPPEDADDAELADAKKAAEAEGAAGPGEGEAGAAGGDGQPAQPAGQAAQDPTKTGQQPQQGQQPADSVMIPKARFDEVNGRVQQAEQAAAYWRGVAEARGVPQAGQAGQGGQQPQPPQPTPEQRLASLHQAQDELAAKFDNGEITMAEFKKQERDLNNQEQTLREESLLKKVQPQPAPQEAPQNLYLNSLTAELETQHPWVQVFDQVGTDADWGYLKNLAIDNLVQRGIDPRQGDMGRYELRREIAELADKFGPALVGERAKAQGIVLPGEQQPQSQNGNGGQPPLSPQAQQRQAKLNLAAGAPPNLRNMGTDAADPSGLPSESRLETMTDDEIGNLPDSVRRRMMGISAA